MQEPRDYDNVDFLLGSRNGLEGQLKDLDQEDLKDLNTYLTHVDRDQAPIRDWRDLLADGQVDRLFSETELYYLFQEAYEPENITLNAKIEDDANSKDFDFRISPSTFDSRIWVEVTLTDIHSTMKNIGGGRMPIDKTGRTIDNKLKSDFKCARKKLSEDEVLVLAVFLQDPDNQSVDIRRWLDEEYYDVREFCDGLLTFTHNTETKLSYHSFTENGRAIESLMEDL